VCIAFAIGSPQYAGAPHGSTPNLEATFHLLGFPMFTYFGSGGDLKVCFWLLNAFFWGFTLAFLCHLLWVVSVKLGRFV
jgi:hypothetical protein